MTSLLAAWQQRSWENHGRSSSQTSDQRLSRFLKRTNSAMALLSVLFVIFSHATALEYANQWTVTIPGGDEAANRVAREIGFDNMGKLFEDEDVYMFRHHSIKKRSLRSSDRHHENLISHEEVSSAEQQIIKKRVKRDYTYQPQSAPRDPLWGKTWYLLPSTKPSMRVTEAWEAGYTGKDIVVTILDDGIEKGHVDLRDNYDSQASRDINDNDDDPEPRRTYNNENRHGTRCAGEVAAMANNDYCSVGIAYNAKIGGVRMLDGQVTDMVEGASIGLRPNHIDIYSASWGPDDDGRTVDGPARRAKEAFRKGVEKGRNGKGSIFVWASGNGGRKDDNCNCDGYTNSIYTLSISSTTEHTNEPWYSEDCSSTLATTYSSGISSEKQIVTTDLYNKCTTSHTGTSASAPLAAGICALALEANPKLTWRDMQHLVVQTANPEGLKATDWAFNGAGRKVSHSYGYGLMDAYAMVQKAKAWVTVPKQHQCNITVLPMSSHREFSDDPLMINFNVSSCVGVMPDRLEHVQAEISATSTRRGDMYIYLTSPSLTRSTLLDARSLDDRSAGFSKWPFMTTHSWDENPTGSWSLKIQTHSNRPNLKARGTLTYFKLVLYGTLNAEWPAGLQVATTTANERTSDSGIHETMPGKSIEAEVSSTSYKSVIAHSPQHYGDEVTEPNCKTRDSSGKVCLVCEEGFVRSYDKLHCLRECPVGYYAALEKVDEKVPRGSDTNNENKWELQQEQRFENEERFDGSKVCTVCAAGIYCIACDGPTVFDCLTCAEGFILAKGQCLLDPDGPPSQRQKIYALSVAVCLLSVVVFIFLFIFLQCCRKNEKCCPGGGNGQLYRYVPNDHYTDDANRDPFDKVGPVFKNGMRPNGVSKALLDDSDDDRT